MKHKSFYGLFLATALFLGVVACEKPSPTDSNRKEAGQKLTTLTETVINGTSIDSKSTVAGLITDAVTGKGIPNVPVSDGYSFVKTDVNGVYQMVRNEKARKIFYTTPSNYQVSLDSKNHTPAFYTSDNLSAGKKYRADFSLVPLDKIEDDFSLVMIGDPQCCVAAEVGRYRLETVADIRSFVDPVRFPNPYAITLGDVTFDSNDMYTLMKASMSNCSIGDRYLPFFQCVGNHDHDSKVADTSNNDEDDYNAVARFVSSFGPTDYSFNRGKAHIVVMDNIKVKSVSSSSKSNGLTWSYDAGLTNDQIEWLRQDIAMVENPSDKLFILCMHIPVRASASTGFSEIKNIAKEFHESHLMIGHTHYPQNYIHTGVVAKGGQTLYEHIHQAACGAWWSGHSSVTGAPNGYSVYNVKGNSIVDWVNKGTSRDESYQMRVYDGNQIYTGSKAYKYSWYSTSQKYAGITAVGNTAFKNAFVAEIWDDDSDNWNVELWQNGSKVGDFKRVADGKSCNVAIVAYYFNELGKSTDTWVNKTASHYWYYVPSSSEPASEKNWEVRATQKIPASGKTKTYKCSTLTTDYKEF